MNRLQSATGMVVVAALSLLLCAICLAAPTDVEREWSDASGKFKVVGRLVEVKDGVALIKSKEGKTLRVPVAKLSKKDQEFLENSDSPFEEVDSRDDSAKADRPAAEAGSSESPVAAADGYNWSSPLTVRWGEAKELDAMADVEWKVPLPESGKLDFQPKRSSLAKKSNFFEKTHPLAINPLCKRAAVGYTVSFNVPETLSRLSVVDLAAGKSVNSEPVAANMRPLAVLNDGASVLMVGAGDEHHEGETPDQLQIWRLSGKTVARSATWTPYVKEKEDFGKKKNAAVVCAIPARENLVLMCSDKGHLALWKLDVRKPVWHVQLSNNFAVAASTDRSLLAVVNDKTLMVVKTEDAEIVGSTSLGPDAHVAWPRVAWSPSGKRLVVSYATTVRVLDVEKGKWLFEYTAPSGLAATQDLSCPNEDYALLDNHLLIHLPTKIQVCEYSGAGEIDTIGGTSFIAMISEAGSLLATGEFPHPAATKMLEKAQSDPSLFLIHPGVAVSIDVSGVGQHQQAVQQGLEKAAKASGYTVAASSPIVITASITGPKQEAISFIARGSYVVNSYTSTIKLVWNGRDLWQTAGTNVPGVVSTKPGQTIEEALAEAGKQPNLKVFEAARFPQFMQKPAENQQGGQASSALMTSQFTMQGLVDGK
jgi:hypothetical protein